MYLIVLPEAESYDQFTLELIKNLVFYGKYEFTWQPAENCQSIANLRKSPKVAASTTAKNPRYNPIQKSAIARLQTRNRGTSILALEAIKTITTHPFPVDEKSIFRISIKFLFWLCRTK